MPVLSPPLREKYTFNHIEVYVLILQQWLHRRDKMANYDEQFMDLEPPPPGMFQPGMFQRPPVFQHQPAAFLQQLAAAPRGNNVKLPPFWASAPEEWFGLCDGQFFLHNVEDERARFYLVLAALPEATARSVADLLRGPPAPDAYSTLRRRLLSSHSLTEYHRMEQLHSTQGLGRMRPPEMLSSMAQLCPAGETATKLFRYLFLQRLPRELRIMLSEDGASPIEQLAERADTLWSHHGGGNGGGRSVAAVVQEEDPSPVAAVRQSDNRGGGRGRGNRGCRGGRGGRGGQRNTATASTQQQPQPQSLSVIARAGTGLCHYHFSYGERAQKCTPPCNWQEN
jgi:hypothetical protein